MVFLGLGRCSDSGPAAEVRRWSTRVVAPTPTARPSRPRWRYENAAAVQKNNELSLLRRLVIVLIAVLALAVDLAVAAHSGDWLDPVTSLPPAVPRVERPLLFPPGVVDVQQKGLVASNLSASAHASIAEEEADPRLRRLHVCVNSGEAYAASWLVTAKYLAASKTYRHAACIFAASLSHLCIVCTCNRSHGLLQPDLGELRDGLVHAHQRIPYVAIHAITFLVQLLNSLYVCLFAYPVYVCMSGCAVRVRPRAPEPGPHGGHGAADAGRPGPRRAAPQHF
jgi:hypothetical protein